MRTLHLNTEWLGVPWPFDMLLAPGVGCFAVPLIQTVHHREAHHIRFVVAAHTQFIHRASPWPGSDPARVPVDGERRCCVEGPLQWDSGSSVLMQREQPCALSR